MNRVAALKRIQRLVALGIASGLLAMGGGNVLGYRAIESFAFGAATVLLGIATVLLFVYASKGEIPNKDFDTAVHKAIEQVNSKDE